jgi:hypothetical protein
MMNLIKNWLWHVMILGIFLVMTGCGGSSNHLVESWQEPGFADKPLGKILVLGVFNEDDVRQLYEDGVVNALEDNGGTAVAGYTLMPKVGDYDEKEEIIAALEKSNADAVMIATFVEFKEKENYRATQAAYVPTMGLGFGISDYYAVSYRRVYDYGHTVTETTVKLEITVFSAKSRKMVWAGATKSVNPKSRGELIKNVSGLILKDMKKDGFL